MRKFSVAVALLTIMGASMAEPASAEVSVGDPVPEFEMVGSDGKTYKSSQFKGKSAFVIAWYPKAFTGG